MKVPPESIGCPLAGPMEWWYLRGGEKLVFTQWNSRNATKKYVVLLI